MDSLTDRILKYEPKSKPNKVVFGVAKGIVTVPIASTLNRLYGSGGKKFGEKDTQQKAEFVGNIIGAAGLFVSQILDGNHPYNLIPVGVMLGDFGYEVYRDLKTNKKERNYQR